MSAAAYWAVFAGMALVAFGFRASFLLLGERMALPRAVRRALDYVPPAVLAALVLPVFFDLHASWTMLDTARLIAGAVAAGVAYRTRSIPATLVVGMAVLWLALWVLPGG